MPMPNAANAEREIASVLLAQWDPLQVRNTPGTHDEYARHAHAVYALLARGSSSVQIARYLHQVEREEMQHPELAAKDLSSLVRLLQAVNLDTTTSG